MGDIIPSPTIVMIPKRKLLGSEDTTKISGANIQQFVSQLTIGSAKITTAMIQDLAVTDAKITTLSVDKLTAGSLTVAATIGTGGSITNANGVKITPTGINIYGVANALTTRATETGTIQCYVGSDGAIYAGAGAVKLDSNGIIVKSNFITLQNAGGTTVGTIGGGSGSVIEIATVNSNFGISIGIGSTVTTVNQITFTNPSGLVAFSCTGINMSTAPYMDLPQYVSSPAAVEGRMYWDTNIHCWLVYTGAAWKALAYVP